MKNQKPEIDIVITYRSGREEVQRHKEGGAKYKALLEDLQKAKMCGAVTGYYHRSVEPPLSAGQQ